MDNTTATTRRLQDAFGNPHELRRYSNGRTILVSLRRNIPSSLENLYRGASLDARNGQSLDALTAKAARLGWK